MARTRPSPADRARYANLADAYLAFCALFFFGGTFLLTNGVGWMTAIALWLISLYLFVASVVMWTRRN